jgi:hypothetical protein
VKIVFPRLVQTLIAMKRRHLWRGWSIAVAVFIALLACPLRTTLIRLGIIAFGAIVWFGLLFLGWRRMWLRVVIAASTLFLAGLILLPSHSRIDQVELRRNYVQQLRSYNKTIYVYGGENCLGVDCSGLVRVAMVQALRHYGLKARDSNALRSSFRLWWFDSNAIDLGKARSRHTVPVTNGDFETLSDHAAILPGDLAVTESGSHVLAYLGDETWIEADPSVGRTHIFTLSGQFASLAGERVRFVCWRWLTEKDI